MLICAHATPGPLSQRARNTLSQQATDWLQKRKVKAFYNLAEEESMSRSVRSMIQVCGLMLRATSHLTVIFYLINSSLSELESCV